MKGKENKSELAYKFLAFNDDDCTCGVCGKQELKGTYALESYTTGDIVRAGSVCGARMLGWTVAAFEKGFNEQKKADILAAKTELRQSEEYIKYSNALDFLNNERDAIERRVMAEIDQDKRTEISATRRTMQSRIEYLAEYKLAFEAKRNEMSTKHNIKSDYIN